MRGGLDKICEFMPATTSPAAVILVRRAERMQLPFGRALVEVNQQEGAYHSAQINPKTERHGAELHCDLGAVLHAHIARSDQMSEIVASHGLTGLY